MLRTGVSLSCSSPRAHRAVIAISTRFPDLSSVMTDHYLLKLFLPSSLARMLPYLKVMGERAGIERARQAERPRERPAPHR
jgi:hypothetical protein